MSCPVRFGLAFAFGVTALATVACKETTGPSSSGNGPLGVGVTIIAGGGQRDTANAELAQALVLQIADSSGVPAGQEVVRFESVPVDSQPYVASVLVGALTSPSYSTFASGTTNDSGEAAILIQLGPYAGSGRVVVSVPRFGYEDTVTFAILPGAAVRLAGLADTALYAGRTGQLHAYVADRNGNRRPDAVTYQSLNTSVATVTNSGAATAVSLGRATVQVQGGTPSLADSTHVNVVPTGTVAAVVGAFHGLPAGTVITMNLDGSGVTPVPQTAGTDNQYLSWTPDGTTLLGHRGYHVFAMDLAGNARFVVPASVGFAEDVWPRYTATGGGWVYFAGVYGNVALYRIRLNGTGLDSVPVGFGTQPYPSPDGTRVAWSDGTLHVFNYATRTDTALGVPGYAPHWSPDGTLIAYATGDPGVISVMKPDGSARRVLSGSAYYGWAFDWSPDSQWLVVYGSSLALIQVQTGLVLPLGYAAGLGQPAWKP